MCQPGLKYVTVLQDDLSFSHPPILYLEYILKVSLLKIEWTAKAYLYYFSDISWKFHAEVSPKFFDAYPTVDLFWSYVNGCMYIVLCTVYVLNILSGQQQIIILTVVFTL